MKPNKTASAKWKFSVYFSLSPRKVNSARNVPQRKSQRNPNPRRGDNVAQAEIMGKMSKLIGGSNKGCRMFFYKLNLKKNVRQVVSWLHLVEKRTSGIFLTFSSLYMNVVNKSM